MYVLLLDCLPTLTDLLRDILDLDSRVRLNDSQKVLLQKRIVECREVSADSDIRRKLCFAISLTQQ